MNEEELHETLVERLAEAVIKISNSNSPDVNERIKGIMEFAIRKEISLEELNDKYDNLLAKRQNTAPKYSIKKTATKEKVTKLKINPTFGGFTRAYIALLNLRPNRTNERHKRFEALLKDYGFSMDDVLANCCKTFKEYYQNTTEQMLHEKMAPSIRYRNRDHLN